MGYNVKKQCERFYALYILPMFRYIVDEIRAYEAAASCNENTARLRQVFNHHDLQQLVNSIRPNEQVSDKRTGSGRSRMVQYAQAFAPVTSRCITRVRFAQKYNF
uniref:Helitron_like_N domain-containing protein n=1 Tax=Heterorhabditis bacteriophora TaxID=37862 RepID=A0A1I7WQT4_HETBA